MHPSLRREPGGHGSRLRCPPRACTAVRLAVWSCSGRFASYAGSARGWRTSARAPSSSPRAAAEVPDRARAELAAVAEELPGAAAGDTAGGARAGAGRRRRDRTAGGPGLVPRAWPSPASTACRRCATAATCCGRVYTTAKVSRSSCLDGRRLAAAAWALEAALTTRPPLRGPGSPW